jgi:N-methylhydantoinase A
VYFDEDLISPLQRDGWWTAPVHRRADLRRGDVVTGPAVIEEYGSTLPLHPGFTAEVDAYGNLVIRRGGAS